MSIVHSDPTPGQLIRDVWCWVATYADGTEGIIAGGLPGLGMTTLMASRECAARWLEPVARRAIKEAKLAGYPAVSCRLVRFTSTEGTRQ